MPPQVRSTNAGSRQVVLLRHGESLWNRENLFSGWTDVDLSDRGRDEGREAGRDLKAVIAALRDAGGCVNRRHLVRVSVKQARCCWRATITTPRAVWLRLRRRRVCPGSKRIRAV